MDERLLREFLAEAEDLIEALYGDLAELRARGHEGRARRELIARAFRRVHTIKGSASTAGLETTASLAHEFESLLDGVRAGRVPSDARFLDAFEDASGALEQSLTAAARGEPLDAAAELIERPRRLAPPPHDAAHASVPAASDDDHLTALPGEITNSLDERERQRLLEAVAEGAGVFSVSVSFGLTDFDEQFRRLSDALSEDGEIISSQPVTSADAPDRVGFQVVYATRVAYEKILACAAPFGATVEEAVASAHGGQTTPPPHIPPTVFVRVALDELDELISAAHEVFGEALAALEPAADAGAAKEPAGAGSEKRADDIPGRLREIEERLKGLRMTPALPTLERAVRAGAVAARAAGRDVDFEIEGGEIRLDRSLAELVAGPLLHLVRNAVVHGIETADERRAAGKPERGRVRLEAAETGRYVTLRVSDDGCGVDSERVARVARARGLVGEGERMTEELALRLIFRPGFSTAERVSVESGRGVGLDVVERALEDAGGEVRAQSRKGAGSTFELRLPARLDPPRGK